jgi:HKD family nuclease
MVEVRVEDWNCLVSHSQELDIISHQKSNIIREQKETIATLKKQNKELKARLEAIKVACS